MLSTLVTYPMVFAASCSIFGISDLRKLAEDTHKFESHYMEKLLGGTIQENPQLYADRSPVLHADKIESPLLVRVSWPYRSRIAVTQPCDVVLIPLQVLQGSIDAVVPPEQSEDIVKAIKGRGGHVEYVLYEGEGHGWRKAETIKAAIEKELHFYEHVFRLTKLG